MFTLDALGKFDGGFFVDDELFSSNGDSVVSLGFEVVVFEQFEAGADVGFFVEVEPGGEGVSVGVEDLVGLEVEVVLGDLGFFLDKLNSGDDIDAGGSAVAVLVGEAVQAFLAGLGAVSAEVVAGRRSDLGEFLEVVSGGFVVEEVEVVNSDSEDIVLFVVVEDDLGVLLDDFVDSVELGDLSRELFCFAVVDDGDFNLEGGLFLGDAEVEEAPVV